MSKKQLKKTDPLTFADLIEYEDMTGDSFDNLQELIQDKKPKYKNIAILGHLRAKREEPDLKFSDYIVERTGDEIVKDAFGDLTEDGEMAEGEEKKEAKSSERGTRQKQDSA